MVMVCVPPGGMVPLVGEKDTPLKLLPADQLRPPGCAPGISPTVTVHLEMPVATVQFALVELMLAGVTVNCGGEDDGLQMT